MDMRTDTRMSGLFLRMPAYVHTHAWPPGPASSSDSWSQQNLY